MKIRHALLAVAGAWTVAATAQTAPMTYNFEGTLTDVPLSLPSLAVGDTFTGTFSIESTAVDLGPSPYYSVQGTYAAGYSMTVTVSGHTYSSSDGEVWVIDGAEDVFIAANKAGLYQAGTPATGPGLDGLLPYGLGLVLISKSNDLFTSTALPSNLTLSSFNSFSFFALNFDAANAWVYGTFTSLTQVTAAPVPEASTGAMLALGLGALAWARRRQRS